MSVLKKASRNSMSEEISQECATDRHSDTPPFSLPRSNFSRPLHFICHSTMLSATVANLLLHPAHSCLGANALPHLPSLPGRAAPLPLPVLSGCARTSAAASSDCEAVPAGVTMCALTYGSASRVSCWRGGRWISGGGKWISRLSRCRAMDAGRPSHADQRLCGSAMLVICQLAVTCKPVSGV